MVWLIGHWDPTKTKQPPLNPDTHNSFSPWTIELNFLQATKAGPEVARCATITLHAGVSGREAQRVVALAQKVLDPSNRRKGRPGLTDMERARLRSEFAKLGIPKSQRRTAMIRKVQEACMRSGNRQLSTTVIGDELRDWLHENNQPVRRYIIEPSSQSPEPS